VIDALFKKKTNTSDHMIDVLSNESQ